MARSLLKDIDLETLYEMRRNRMSNQEIADSVGVSRVTIYNLIGPQPKELNKKPGPRTPKAIVESKSEATPPPACLAVSNRIVELHGMYGKYDVDIKEGSIVIYNSSAQVMRVGKDMLDTFIEELNAIKRKMEVLKFENEMW